MKWDHAHKTQRALVYSCKTDIVHDDNVVRLDVAMRDPCTETQAKSMASGSQKRRESRGEEDTDTEILADRQHTQTQPCTRNINIPSGPVVDILVPQSGLV